RSLAPPRPSAGAGALQRPSRTAGDDARSALLWRREGTRRLRGTFGPLHAPARSTAERGVRTCARLARPFGRLAAPARRLAAALRRARLIFPVAGWRDRDRTPRRVARRARGDGVGAPRRSPEGSARSGRRPAPLGLSPPAPALPLRARGVQARLGARRTD